MQHEKRLYNKFHPHISGPLGGTFHRFGTNVVLRLGSPAVAPVRRLQAVCALRQVQGNARRRVCRAASGEQRVGRCFGRTSLLQGHDGRSGHCGDACHRQWSHRVDESRREAFGRRRRTAARGYHAGTLGPRVRTASRWQRIFLQLLAGGDAKLGPQHHSPEKYTWSNGEKQGRCVAQAGACAHPRDYELNDSYNLSLRDSVHECAQRLIR